MQEDCEMNFIMDKFYNNKKRIVKFMECFLFTYNERVYFLMAAGCIVRNMNCTRISKLNNGK